MSKTECILAIDQGTTGTTACLVSKSGFILAKHNVEFRQIYPQPGWVEHNPQDIWKSTKQAVQKVLEKSRTKKIHSIGITNQRETILIWNKKTGKVLHNAIVWQCRRTKDFCDKLRKTSKSKIKSKTGLVIDPYFSASKARWLLNRYKNKDTIVGTIDTFLLWKLTGGMAHKTDVTNASRTQLFNIKTLSWDEELLKIFKVPKHTLASVMPSGSIFGTTKDLDFLPNGIPISGMIGDQQAALFGGGSFNPGNTKCTLGTGSFMLMNIGDKPKNARHCLTTIAWQLKQDKPAVYALEGSVFICAAAVSWLRDGLKIIKDAKEIESLAKKESDSGGVEFVPALTGLGSPHWDAGARGLICGLTRGTNRSHIARATLEAMALQNCEVLFEMEKIKKIKKIKIDGGAAKNNLLLQYHSDYLGVEVTKPKIVETTAMGAAFMAGLTTGFWKNLNEIENILKVDKVFKCKMTKQKRNMRLASWQKAIKKTKDKS